MGIKLGVLTAIDSGWDVNPSGWASLGAAAQLAKDPTWKIIEVSNSCLRASCCLEWVDARHSVFDAIAFWSSCCVGGSWTLVAETNDSLRTFTIDFAPRLV